MKWAILYSSHLPVNLLNGLIFAYTSQYKNLPDLRQLIVHKENMSATSGSSY